MTRDAIEAVIPRLRRYALALLRDRERADDLVQDTLERALRKWSLWRSGSDLRAWLFTIMHNLYVNQLRTAARPALPLEGDALEVPAAGSPDASAELGDLLDALERLAPEFRAVVLLVGLEELSYAEAAQVLGIPKGTVMSRLSRGREQLRQLMAGEAAPRLRSVK